jgi:hypothetical protein
MVVDVFPVKIKGEIGHRLADLFGIMEDLDNVAELCETLAGRLSRWAAPGALREAEALQAAAIVRYGRCFKRSKRSAAPADWILKLPESEQRVHHECIALRDKHIAHSENDWEINIPVVYLRRDRANDLVSVDQVQVKRDAILLARPEWLQALREVAIAIAQRARTEYDEERETVLRHMKAQPVEELLASCGDDWQLPGAKDISDFRGR